MGPSAAAEERRPTFPLAAGVFFDGRLHPARPLTPAPPGLRGGNGVPEWTRTSPAVRVTTATVAGAGGWGRPRELRRMEMGGPPRTEENRDAEPSPQRLAAAAGQLFQSSGCRSCAARVAREKDGPGVAGWPSQPGRDPSASTFLLRDFLLLHSFPLPFLGFEVTEVSPQLERQ